MNSIKKDQINKKNEYFLIPKYKCNFNVLKLLINNIIIGNLICLYAYFNYHHSINLLSITINY